MNALEIPTILHIDDNDADLEFTQEAWIEYGPRVTFIVARDGEAGIRQIQAIIALQVAMPDLILLDLSLPKISGHEVLAYIRSQPELALLPVIILTGTPTTEERSLSLKLGATDHIIKPTGITETVALIERLKPYLRS
jgi:DNA-binding response OmpR family regulator